jgi:hypothetical protein
VSGPSGKQSKRSGKGALLAVRKLTEAWLRQDWEGMSFWLSEDVTEIGPAFRGAIQGKVDFFKKYRPYLTGPPEILAYRIIRPKVNPLSERFTLIYFSFRMKARRKGRSESSQGKESMLLEKIQGRWLVRFIHWHSDPLGQK